MHNISGKTNDAIMTILFGTLSKDESDKYADEKEEIYRDLYSPHIKEVHGLKAFINALKKRNIKVAVATSAPRKNRDFGFERLDMKDTFHIVKGVEDVTNGKPHPEIFLKTAEELYVEPKKCIVFEDSPSGIKAARNAGMDVVAVLTSHTKEELKDADYWIDDYSQLK